MIMRWEGRGWSCVVGEWQVGLDAKREEGRKEMKERKKQREKGRERKVERER